MDADHPSEPFTVFLARERGHEYHIDHYRDRFYIRSNAGAKNFRLVETDTSRFGRDNWREVVPHRAEVLLEGFELFRDHLVLQERFNGLVQLRVQPWVGNSEHEIQFPEAVYDPYIDAVLGVSLSLDKATTFGLVGESGSGKTTLGRAIIGLVPAKEGTIRFNGADLTGLSDSVYKPYRRDIAMMFQDPVASLSPRRTVHALVTEPFIIHLSLIHI